MVRILVAFDGTSAGINQQIVTNLLPTGYQVMTLNPGVLPDPMPDICLVDLGRWHDLVDLTGKRRLSPTTRLKEPGRLLLVNGHDLARLTSQVRYYADEILTVPFHPLELHVRLQKLLHMKQRSEQQRRIYDHLATTNKALESTSDAILVANIEGVVLYSNPAFRRIFGYTVNELNVGGIPGILFQQPALGDQVFNTVRDQGSWKGEVELVASTGKSVPFLLHVDRIQDDEGQAIGFISIGSDITQHRRVAAIEQEQRQLAEAQLNTARALTSTLQLNEVFERILDNISQVVPGDAGNIILIQEGRAQLVDRDDYASTASLEQLEKLRIGHEPAWSYDDLRTILETNAPLVIPDTQQYLASHHDMTNRTPWLHSHIGIPIRLRDEIIGFLNVDSIHPGLFTRHHAERLQLFAEQAAIAIHNARLHEQAQKLAIIEERQRLARNLHDAVSQILFSSTLIAEAIPRLWEMEPDAVPSRLEQIRTLNRSALAEMRTLLLELHPERLLETEISQLLHQLVVGVLGQAHLHITLKIPPRLDLPPDIHEAVYYLTQEALNNVVKHAEASQVTVQLQREDRRLVLTVADNGRGFDPDHISPTSLGLTNLRERARTTGGVFTIQSQVGHGTRLTVYWSNDLMGRSGANG